MEQAVMFIIIENNKILLEKRPDDKKEDPGLIAIPGGHVEENETPEDALRRELKEELGVELEKFAFVCNVPYVSSIGKKYGLFYYVVQSYEGKISKEDVGDLIFVDLKEAESVLVIEADKIAFRKLMKQKH